MKKILIVAPAWVGDMVMAQTLFKNIKGHQPQAVLDLLAPPWTAEIAQKMPEVNAIHILPLAHGIFGLKKRWQIGRALRHQQYDEAIVLPNSWKSALIPWFAGIPVRSGFQGEMRFGLLNDRRRLDKQALPLMIERFMILGQASDQPLSKPYPRPRLSASPEAAQSLMQELGLDPQVPSIALCPGAEYGPAKRWPSEHYASLAQLLRNQGYQICLMGSKKDEAIANEIKARSGVECHNLCGRTGLNQAVDILAAMTAVVSNDSGLMHIAAALDKPMVAIYGSSSTAFTPPLSDRVKILNLALPCSPCFQRECPLEHLNCLKQISPISVLTALQTMLKEESRLR